MPNIADNTLGKYRRVLRLYILPELGQVKLAQITPEVVASHAPGTSYTPSRTSPTTRPGSIGGCFGSTSCLRRAL